MRLAYSVIGKGYPIVRASHWFTHLEYDLKSPIWRYLYEGLAQRHSLVRYDARGQGLSQRDVNEISFERWVDDLEAVADALSLERFALLGVSQGASIAIAYSVRHPERLSHLILYGGFARGHLHRGGDPQKQRRLADLNRTMIREGWGSDHEAYRQWFTSQFIPDGTAEQFHWFNDLERISATPEVAERFVDVVVDVDVSALLPRVQTPTLVLHCKDEVRVPFSLGQELAQNIPGAKFVPLPGRNHLFMSNEPAHRLFLEAVGEFMGDPPLRGPLPGSASTRERIDAAVTRVERHWSIKVAVILAAITGLVIFVMEMWRIFRH